MCGEKGRKGKAPSYLFLSGKPGVGRGKFEVFKGEGAKKA